MKLKHMKALLFLVIILNNVTLAHAILFVRDKPSFLIQGTYITILMDIMGYFLYKIMGILSDE